MKKIISGILTLSLAIILFANMEQRCQSRNRTSCKRLKSIINHMWIIKVLRLQKCGRGFLYPCLKFKRLPFLFNAFCNLMFSFSNCSFSRFNSRTCCSSSSIWFFITMSPMYLLGSIIPACCSNARSIWRNFWIFSSSIPCSRSFFFSCSFQ